jgi:Fe-S cluster assembly scaffold protein SufB
MKGLTMPRNNVVSNQGVYHIPSTKDRTQYLLDLSQVNLPILHLVIAPESDIDLLIINGSYDLKIDVDVADHVQGKIQFAMFGSNKNLHWHASVGANVNLEAAIADFTQGKGKVFVTFEMLGRDSNIEWRTAALSSHQDRKFYAINFTHKNFNTYANMTNYGVTEGNSTLQFTGTGHILNGAKFSKTHQAAKIMVFDAACLGRADPVLKIDENEVEASHAATVGRVNEDHLYYLQTRGLSKNEAKRLITLGYLQPIIQYFTDNSIQDTLSAQIQSGTQR